MSVDWDELAAAVGVIDHCGTDDARAALARLGPGVDDALDGAVDHYVTCAGSSGAELARSVLRLLRRPEAAQRCWEVYRAHADPERRRNAIELLSFVGDASALPHVDALLDDDDDTIRAYAVKLLDQLLWDRAIEAEQAIPLLRRVIRRGPQRVRSQALRVRYFLARARRAPGPTAPPDDPRAPS